MNFILCLARCPRITNLLSNKLLSLACLIIFCGMSAPAWAQYRPPRDAKQPITQTIFGGTRGGCNGGEQSIRLLAPKQYMGQTISTHPTFAWITPNVESYPIKFRLFQYGENNRLELVKQVELQGTPGMMTWTMPENEPGLEMGKQYYWQVAIICNVNRPSANPFDEAGLDVVALSPQLETQLSNNPDPLQQAKLYAEAGLWYDAFAQVALLSDPEAIEMRRSLLEQKD